MTTGIIGGSGLYEMEGLRNLRRRELKTPFGRPSDAYTCGTLGDHEVCFLPRHGVGHRIMPSEINYRANIYGFKMLGVERVVSVSAVGSLKTELVPGDIVLPDQYFDRTKNSAQHTFFGDGIVGHVAFSDPACPQLRELVAACAKKVVNRIRPKDRGKVHEGGTYVNMEGPAFSTRSESIFYKKLGFDVIGMTNLAEAKLCREAEMCFQAVAMVTDYDCWHISKEPVTADMVVAKLVANTVLAREIIKELIPFLGVNNRTCGCERALEHAIVTDRKVIPPRIKKTLTLLIGKYM